LTIHRRLVVQYGRRRRLHRTITTTGTIARRRNFEYPKTMTDDEIARLGVLVSEVDRPVQPPLPRYATDIMPPDLTEEEALQRALQNSAPQPSPPPPPPAYNPWAPPPPPPPPSTAQAYVPLVDNCP
jgi:hypothetical protein